MQPTARSAPAAVELDRARRRRRARGPTAPARRRRGPAGSPRRGRPARPTGRRRARGRRRRPARRARRPAPPGRAPRRCRPAISRTVMPRASATPGDDVAVGREVVGGADQHVAPGAGLRAGHQQLVEVHRRRVADQHLAGPCARARRRPGRRRCGWPRRSSDDHEPTSPSPHCCSTTRASAAGVSRGQPAERVPVEVEEPVGAVVVGAGEAARGSRPADRRRRAPRRRRG